MCARRGFFRPKKLWIAILAAVSAQAGAQVTVSYGVPEGFGEVAMDNAATYVATYEGKTLPGLIRYSAKDAKLEFDIDQYSQAGLSVEEIRAIRDVLALVDYKQCANGCDIQVRGHYVMLDKVRRTLDIRSARSDYLSPFTTWGLVSNQALDLRGSSDGYRAMNINGNTWFGLPNQSFGYMNWYVNQSRQHGRTWSSHDVSSYYLQKNFAGSYLRAGKQNSIDYASGSISTMLTPSFDQFVTFGSQDHLRSARDAGHLVLYSTTEGTYEFYRGGRLIRQQPAVLGRNEISFVDLPGGYYAMEIRLVDRNGNLLNREVRDINNLNFSRGRNAWHVTAGKALGTGSRLLQGGISRNMSQFYLNGSVVAGENSKWAAEVNATRPTRIGKTDLTPTVGILSGERGTGGYFNVYLTDSDLGNLSVSRYMNPDVSQFYRGSPSTAVSYSRNIHKTSLSYNYYRRVGGETHQAEARWNYRPNGLWSTFALGIQKGGFAGRNNDFAVYFNMTWTLDDSQTSVRAARYDGKTQVSGDYRKDFRDSYGTSSAGVTVNRYDNGTSLSAYGSRSGTRGDTSLNIAHDNNATSASFNYRGMVAANADGLAAGRYSSDGSAMLLTTPGVAGLPYGFNVEGHPVGSGGKYAVPLGRYNDVSFARVMSQSDQLDMNIEVPANIVRAHPGQVYSANAKVDISMSYSGILVDEDGKPVGGQIVETGDVAYSNGLFSILSKTVLPKITVQQAQRSYSCDLSKTFNGSYYRCQ